MILMPPKWKMKSELEYTEHGWRYTTDTARHHRDSHWDYCGKGVYHFTLVVAERYPLFGQLAGTSPEEAYIEFNAFGRQALELLRDEPRFYREKGYEFKILASMVMPDHIHVAIQVLQPLPKSIGTVIRGFKSACTSLYKKTYASTCGNYAAKKENEETHDFHFSRIFTRTNTIWQSDAAYYYERIIHGYSQLDAMIKYIKDNPRRLWLKRANPDLFRIRQNIRIGQTTCAALGNIFLADYPQRAVVQCSRRLAQGEIDTRKEACLAEAANGTVFVSAAISEGEKQICRALREAGFPLVILLNEGFPEPDSPHYRYFKPQGVYFEACAAGRLLLVEPSQAFYERSDIAAKVIAKAGDIPHDTRRYRFLALNAMAEEFAR